MSMPNGGPKWLFLLHQLPAKPAYARVKVWRRLQSLGAVTVKNAVYALPDNSETREDFAWLAKEIAESGGEALVCEAELVEGLTDEALRATFDAARAMRTTSASPPRRACWPSASTRSRRTPLPPTSQPRRCACARQLLETRAIDFFGADGRDAADRSRRRSRWRDCRRSSVMSDRHRYRRRRAPMRCAARSG